MTAPIAMGIAQEIGGIAGAGCRVRRGHRHPRRVARQVRAQRRARVRRLARAADLRSGSRRTASEPRGHSRSMRKLARLRASRLRCTASRPCCSWGYALPSAADSHRAHGWKPFTPACQSRNAKMSARSSYCDFFVDPRPWPSVVINAQQDWLPARGRGHQSCRHWRHPRHHIADR